MAANVTVAFNPTFIKESSSIIRIQCKTDTTMETVFGKLANKVNLDKNYLVKFFEFYYEGKKINIEKTPTIKSLIGENNSPSSPNIDININRILGIMKCNKCNGNNSIIKIENYLLHFYECCGNREHEEYKLLENYEKTQSIDYNINCSKCKEGEKKTNFEQYYKCLNCSKLQKSSKYYCNSHIKHADKGNHKTVKYEEKSYYCPVHFNHFVSYCTKCNTNLCDQCIKDKSHEKNTIQNLSEMIPNEGSTQNIEKELTKIKEKISVLKIKVDKIKEMMDGAVKIMEKYCEIEEDIIQKYNKYNNNTNINNININNTNNNNTKLLNYQVVRTIENLVDSNRTITNDLDFLLSDKDEKDDWKKKCDKLIGIYKADRSYYEKGNTNTVNNNENKQNKTIKEDNSINGNNQNNSLEGTNKAGRSNNKQKSNIKK
jgi:hypothetical protein